MFYVQTERLAGAVSNDAEEMLLKALELSHQEDRGFVLHELGSLGACAPENAGARFPRLARGRGFLGIAVWAEGRHRAMGGEQNPGELVSGRGCSPQYHSNSGLIRRKFSARQTNVHSPETFFSPLKLNCRKPSTDLTQPLTGSTILLRLE